MKSKYYFEVIEDATIGVWLYDNSILPLTWTLAVELVSSYYIFILAETIVFYQYRWILYLILIVWTLIPTITDRYEFTNYAVYSFKESHVPESLIQAVIKNIPLFTAGVILADVEHLTKGMGRPLDYIRNMNIWFKIPLNSLLIFIFCVYGSVH